MQIELTEEELIEIVIASVCVGFASNSFPWAIATWWVLWAIFTMIFVGWKEDSK